MTVHLAHHVVLCAKNILTQLWLATIKHQMDKCVDLVVWCCLESGHAPPNTRSKVSLEILMFSEMQRQAIERKLDNNDSEYNSNYENYSHWSNP